ncbi:protein Lines homolog 1 [Peromyscus californicus insignis]|uniref:protein Lines homolog 1 n=1 Tax=Peromyscus californicus insignis TaxID=564181 RepID=UPI0022A6CCC8|nr:protein Lines homolog 1 [Peromyscus californicus insignis]XP_052617172.1 protein Lines homolog 1 [Peromyscus californicus insignis]XP_052617173.1 protein Lines homolog 1 [Peromyscus californicus insignis]XP_052617174.1 protein Lines homolog 1 [Peromyscus californicus insignis]
MESVQEILDQLYKKVLLGAILEDDVYGYIHYLNPDLSEQAGYTAPSLAQSDVNGTLDGVPGQHGPSSNEPTNLPEARECAKRHFQMSTAREVKLLQLTVINVILSRVLSAETETHAKEKYRELIKVLLQSTEVDSKLIWMLQNSDKLLSHMAAKCLSSLLYFQLTEKMMLSNPWITFCQKHLSESSGSSEAAHCLWILTAVIKEIFRESHSRQAEILKQLLVLFDITFEVFYNSLFSQHFGNFQNPSNIVNSLVCFLELLELLIASRIHLKLHFRSQRMLFLKPHALDSLAWPVPAFVKRKLVIVIKKCLLGKMGEDLCRGSVPALMSPDHLLDSDVLALADALLHAVHLGLWKELSVPGKPSCFGGDEVQPGCRPRSGPDHVTLRAASLITMKSLEIKFQNCTSATEMKVDLQKFMAELLTFLKPHLQPSLQLHNPCEWLSRVFIEQDDDMLEAAKASLSIYLQLTRGGDDASGSLTQENEAWIHYTHRNGCNPHCIFLFLLKNIVFDSTVLLDFLISSETCFLEYFVKYLKLLQKDWGHFLSICKFFDAVESQRGVNTRGPVSSLVQDRGTSHIVPDALASPVGPRNACPCVPWASDASSESHSQVVMSKETHTVPAHGPPSQPPLSLVDYGSSEDSDEEATNQHLANSKQTPLCQEMSREIQRLPRTCKDQNRLSGEPQLGPLLPQESGPPFGAAGDIAPSGTVWEVGVLFRTVKCLKELQGAIYRLQEKSLFPYNPAALLKLLKGVEAKCDEV